jgi:hypothetical protein
MNFFKQLAYRPFFIKLLHWEYWSFGTVYAPLYLYWIWLCIRARSLFFFNASNPTIKNGGFLMESKKEIYDIMPQALYPPTLLFKAGASEAAITTALEGTPLGYPLIGKPDIGGRGKGVKKLYNMAEVLQYAQQSKVDFLLQQFVPFENEIGVFYYRFPGEDKGVVSGIVGKEFLTVKGDGTSTILQLLQKDMRFILQLPVLKATYGKTLNNILPANEKFLMVPYGNHARGAKFIDVSHLTDERLTNTIDGICKQIPQFYYGRMDVRYNTWEELCEGKNFSVIEVNGAGSEPTHIYDPKHSIFFAWYEICRHWNLLYKRSIINHKKHKAPYLSFTDGVKMFKENSAYEKIFAESN